MTAPPSLVRRVGVIGDVHGEHTALSGALTYLSGLALPVDTILCTGDLVDGHEGTCVDRCCELLQEHRVLTVRGNHDRWFFEREGARERLGMSHEPIGESSRALLANLPTTLRFATPLGELLLCHGLGENDLAELFPETDDTRVEEMLKDHLGEITEGPGVRFLINGHTHTKMVRRLGALTILNVGTLQWGYSPGFAVADFEHGEVQFFEVDPDSGIVTPSETCPL